MPSSTSSSKQYQRDIPDRDWRTVILITMLVVMSAIGLWEVLARSMHHIPGTYQQDLTAMWAEERKKLDEPDHTIRVVLIGSSRMLFAADLDIMERGFGTRPLQLSIAGTSPAIILENIVEQTDFDGLIVVGVAPFLFNRLNGQFFGDEAMEWYHGKAPSAYTGVAIHRFLSDYFGFLDESFELGVLMEHYITLPEREGALKLHENGWKLGDVYADRQTDLWAPVEVVGSFDNVHVTNFWESVFRRPLPTAEDKAKRVSESVAFFKPLIEQLRERGGDIVFIRMPSDGKYKQRDIDSNHDIDIWLPMVEGFDAPAINTMDHSALSSELDLPEWSHLSRESQDLFSERIVSYIDNAFKEKRGYSMFSVISNESDK